MREYWLYSAVFLMGMVVARHDLFSALKRTAAAWRPAARTVIGLAACALSLAMGSYLGDRFMAWTTLPLCAGVILLSAAHGPLWRGMVRLGRHTTYIWLTHTYFLYYAFPTYLYRLKHPVLIIAACLALSLLTALVLETVEDRVLPALGKRLLYKPLPQEGKEP